MRGGLRELERTAETGKAGVDVRKVKGIAEGREGCGGRCMVLHWS